MLRLFGTARTSSRVARRHNSTKTARSGPVSVRSVARQEGTGRAIVGVLNATTINHHRTSRLLTTRSTPHEHVHHRGGNIEDASEKFAPLDTFARRHIGPNDEEVAHMLRELGYESLDKLIDDVIPAHIRFDRSLALRRGNISEKVVFEDMKEMMAHNKVYRSYIGMGYANSIVPKVIQRNILENPMWYTPYTPYQAEISQGRLEALFYFQTMISDLTGLPVANASMLDEASAAAEAMTMCYNHSKGKRPIFLVSDTVFPQTRSVLATRAAALGIELHIGSSLTYDFEQNEVCGALLQYPTAYGHVIDWTNIIDKVHKAGGLAVVATDLLALTVLKAPGEFGADIVIGNSQRFGVPLNYGGPHAAFMAVRENLMRKLPGRLVGLSTDAQGNPAYRLALQTREQHIRRESATSNICTAQALLANTAVAYAIYHGPDGLRRIAERTHRMAALLALGLDQLDVAIYHQPKKFFDTVCATAPAGTAATVRELQKRQINVNRVNEMTLGITMDETVDLGDVQDILDSFADAMDIAQVPSVYDLQDQLDEDDLIINNPIFRRTTPYLTHEVFNSNHTETNLMRFLYQTAGKDYGLQTGSIMLGSCTMKLNAASEMMPITWSETCDLHPFVPPDQVAGYRELTDTLCQSLCEITGFERFSLQPNSGAQGEYAGLLAIRNYHRSIGHGNRNVCLIPSSAHGTNPASAKLAGMKVVVVKCTDDGRIDLDDLRAKAEKHSKSLSCMMITYPSTYGLFEASIIELCETIHEHGGQVYLDGANMNAQLGLVRPADIGADVCHLNLHKTFCIPHGGGGPGVGPIGVASHLVPFLPGHAVVPLMGLSTQNSVSAAPWGSAAILPITWMFIELMGAEGLRKASMVAILNANYMRKRLLGHYDVRFKGPNGFVAHEFIIDLKKIKSKTGITAEDIAKRMMDYGLHAPTVHWPVQDALMVEPTESESLMELDRMCDALILIREEIREVEDGTAEQGNNLLSNSPHSMLVSTSDVWPFPYSRERAAFPTQWARDHKFWPTVGRVDNAAGDRNIVCVCPPLSAYEDDHE